MRQVIEHTGCVRTPELKELFADVFRRPESSGNSNNSSGSHLVRQETGKNSTGTQATFLAVTKRSCSVGTSTAHSVTHSTGTDMGTDLDPPFEVDVSSMICANDKKYSQQDIHSVTASL